jgi:hypothetical protein
MGMGCAFENAKRTSSWSVRNKNAQGLGTLRSKGSFHGVLVCSTLVPARAPFRRLFLFPHSHVAPPSNFPKAVLFTHEQSLSLWSLWSIDQSRIDRYWEYFYLIFEANYSIKLPLCPFSSPWLRLCLEPKCKRCTVNGGTFS